MSEETRAYTCADCAQVTCGKGKGDFPPFCLTKNAEEGLLEEAVAAYDEGDNRQMMIHAAQVEFEKYCQYTRIEETMEFARRMGFSKLGIATCAGLIAETRVLARILRAGGFEVFGVACKVGAYPKSDIGIDKCCEAVGKTMCNPIMQAKLLNREQTQMNLIVGLCVGHDMLFTRYSQAPVSTLIAKDRVLGHNPAAAIYTAGSYYKKLEQKA